MRRIRVETVVQQDGEVSLTGLPCRKGERVEALVSFPDSGDMNSRRQARERFLSRARASNFRSAGSYPSRDLD